MLSRKDFIQASLETNLFFQRIIKEHLLFMEVNIASANLEYITEANVLKKCFEDLLAETTIFSNSAVRNEVLKSNEIITNYTLRAENVTSKLTGASINMEITEAEYDLQSDSSFGYTQWLEEKIHSINCRSLNILVEVIEFKEKILKLVLDCKISVSIYPLMIDHFLREAELYYFLLEPLVKKTLPKEITYNELKFWNHIMEDHGKFIDGMLDPTEEDLKRKAKNFAETFEKLVEESIQCNEKLLMQKSLKEIEDMGDFKQTILERLLECKIKSIIPPLLGDHVLREANHYIRILKEMEI